MAKRIFYGNDARQRILNGAEQLYEAVKVTYGPRGNNVMIDRYGAPTLTHDGVTVAESIELEDVDDQTLGQNAGVDLIKQAASKMNHSVGDGTTSVTILTYMLLREANMYIAAGHNAQGVRREIEEAGARVLKHLDTLSKPIKDLKETVAVATISAGSEELGKLIGSLAVAVGVDGVINVEQGAGPETTFEMIEGYSYDKGFTSPLFITDPAKQEASYDNPQILLVDKKLENPQELFALIDKARKDQKPERPLVIIADDVIGKALSFLTFNKNDGRLPVVAAKAPGFGPMRTEMLSDIATLTGAEIEGRCGSARRVIVGKDKTTIIDGAGAKEDIVARVEALKQQITNETSEYEKTRLEARLASLSGRVAIIKAGGKSETEIEELKYRIDDAVCATKAAMADGIVAGGGVTMLKLADYKITDSNIVSGALRQPFTQLMENSGHNSGAMLAQIEQAKFGMGFDVNKPDELISLLDAGIIDPTKVVREVISTAVSIAAAACTMGALVVEIPTKTE